MQLPYDQEKSHTQLARSRRCWKARSLPPGAYPLHDPAGYVASVAAEKIDAGLRKALVGKWPTRGEAETPGRMPGTRSGCSDSRWYA